MDKKISYKIFKELRSIQNKKGQPPHTAPAPLNGHRWKVVGGAPLLSTPFLGILCTYMYICVYSIP